MLVFALSVQRTIFALSMPYLARRKRLPMSVKTHSWLTQLEIYWKFCDISKLPVAVEQRSWIRRRHTRKPGRHAL